MTAELMTAEIMVGTPATSGPVSCIDTRPDICIGIDYDNPADYIDMYLHGYGIDREYICIRSTANSELRAQILQLANIGMSPPP